MKSLIQPAAWMMGALVAISIGCHGGQHDSGSGDDLDDPFAESLTEQYGPFVVTSIVDQAEGTISTTVWDEDQVELLFEQTYHVATHSMMFEHFGLGVAGGHPMEEATTPALAELNELAAALYNMMPPDPATAAVAYDKTGCDLGPAHDYFSCQTSAGGCCDTHDQCFDQNGCSAASWVCSPVSCVPTKLIPGVFGAVAGVVCNVAQQAFCSEEDKSLDCLKCNANAVGCFVGSIGGGGPGPSECCGRTAAGEKCDEERDCPGRVDANGQCSPCDPNVPGQCKPDDDPCSYNYECASGHCAGGSCEPPCPPDDPNCDDDPDCPPDQTCPPPCEGEDCDDEPPCLVDCPPPPGGPGVPGPGGPVMGPTDPNEKIGPAGIGEDRRIQYGQTMPYQILFENNAEAGANVAVQEIVIVDYLDANVDWTTVDFGDINYGGRVITVPDGVLDFQITDVPPNDGCVIFGTAEAELAVELALTFNAQNGRIELRLKVIDTATNDFPFDPFAGIMPPDGTVCANGHITYTVKPLFSTPPGTVVTNEASIVFEFEAPIVTNQVWNTIY